jgi:putative inorganic carbon (hco3(-)) transporter
LPDRTGRTCGAQAGSIDVRALVLTTFCLFALTTVFAYPFMGVIMWHWLSLMNPHRLAYGFTAGIPIVMITGILTLFMWVVSREPKSLPKSPPTYLMIAFVLWFSMSTLAAWNEAAYVKWDESIRIFLMIFVTLAMTTTRDRILALVVVAAVSIGFYGIKGGIFSLLTGGSARILGPDGTFFHDNNQCGLALLMVLPLWLYLSEIIKYKALKIWVMAAAALIAIAILLTYSRGALVGLVVVGFFIWLSSRRKAVSAIVVGGLIFIGAPYIPKEWYARMDTMQTYEEDQSATLRLQSWTQGWAMARDKPILGYGFKSYVNRDVYEKYRAESGLHKPFEAHSVYFQLLGEQGFVGLGIFIALTGYCLRASHRMYRAMSKIPEMFWASRLARALFLSIIAFLASGTFLSQAYFDLYYFMLALVICLQRVVAEPADVSAETAPIWQRITTLLQPQRPKYNPALPTGAYEQKSPR